MSTNMPGICRPIIMVWAIFLWLFFMGGCAVKPALVNVEGLAQPLAVGAIYDTSRDKVIDFDQLVQQLASTRVVYAGERHNLPAHHQIQLDIIRALVERGLDVTVGMEMFDYTYQQRLDQWSAGQLEWDAFLRGTHWYANWRFDDTLYKDILLYIKAKKLKLVGLNIPFHIPPRISVGGLDNLQKADRALLPKDIDTSIVAHRAYVKEIFNMHHIKGRRNFEDFYAAQCAWEDGMARSVADNLGKGIMVVIAGNGHIIRKFGIPDRAFKRSRAAFKTVYLATPGMEASVEDGDFIWVTGDNVKKPHR